MAYFYSDIAFDMTNPNFSFFNSNIIASVTQLNQIYTFDAELFVQKDNTVYNYQDAYISRSKTTTTDLRIELRGSGFNQGVGGIPTTGTVTNLAFVVPVDGTTQLVMWDFSAPIGSFLAAISTNSPTDDTALLLSIFSGDDSIYLSQFADVGVAENGNDYLSGYGGDDILYGGSGNDEIWGDAGTDLIYGESGVDTAGFSGARSAYTITQGATGVFTIAGPDGTDTVRSTEFAAFADQTIRLLPGTGTTVNFQTDAPSTYMAAIRDFDGNNLGAAAGWVKIGAADINGDGDTDQVFANRTIGRFAEVGTAADGKVYFSDHGWAGETRVVGIYVDPLVQSGQVTAGGPNDSQRRFQNDLTIGNIKGVLGAGDYDRNGLQEVYFSLTDGTAYLHAYMHADGNIQYANYQSQQQVIDYLAQNNWAASTYTGWFG